MNSKIKILPVISFLAISITMQAGPNPPVTVVGKLRDVMQGDSKERIRIDALDLKHVYGVGPLAEMDGEVTIIDGSVALARVQGDGSIRIDHKPSGGMPFLVYSHVHEWSKVEIPSSVVSGKDLEQFLEESATRMGLDSNTPFPFLVQGKFKNVSFHVVRTGKPGTNAHDNSVGFTEREVSGQIVGFFSKHDQGVFTHHDSFVHMHLDAEARSLSGHVESLEFDPLAKGVLFLPSPNQAGNAGKTAP